MVGLFDVRPHLQKFMTSITLKTIAFCLALSLGIAHAQKYKTPVQLLHTGKDNVGLRLAFEVREAIRASQSMKLVIATEADPRIKVHLVTLDPSSSSPGGSTVAALAITLDGKLIDGNGIFLGVSTQSCGTLRTQECAKSIVADIDEEIETMKKDWPTLARALKQGN